MKRLLILAVALSFFAGWSVAEPVELPVPEASAPAPLPAPEPAADELADLQEDAVADEQQAETVVEGEGGECQSTMISEEEMRANAGCTYTCAHPFMCPWIPGLPGASCVNGCCQW